jgi:hypothetical protein
MKWLWKANCAQCTYESKWYSRQWIARVIALIHSIGSHPYGRMTIAAADTETISRNETRLPGE